MEIAGHCRKQVETDPQICQNRQGDPVTSHPYVQRMRVQDFVSSNTLASLVSWPQSSNRGVVNSRTKLGSFHFGGE